MSGSVGSKTVTPLCFDWINIGVTSMIPGYETKYSVQWSTGTWVEHVSFSNHNFNISYNTLLSSSHNLKWYRYVHWVYQTQRCIRKWLIDTLGWSHCGLVLNWMFVKIPVIWVLATKNLWILFSSKIYLAISCLWHRYKETSMCSLWLHRIPTMSVGAPQRVGKWKARTDPPMQLTWFH